MESREINKLHHIRCVVVWTHSLTHLIRVCGKLREKTRTLDLGVFIVRHRRRNPICAMMGARFVTMELLSMGIWDVDRWLKCVSY